MSRGKLVKMTCLCGALVLGCGPGGCEERDQADPVTGQAPAPDPMATQPGAPDAAQPKAPAERELEPALRDLRDHGAVEFRPPSPVEANAYRTWLATTATAGWTGRLPTLPPPSGFTARWLAAGTLWLLAEQPDHKRGAGAVILRPDHGSNLVVEVPHSFFDSSTLPIGLSVFEGARARALLVNTFHRGGSGAAAERKEIALSGESPFDVAHIPESFFLAAHGGLLDAEPSSVVVQLHGFSTTSVRGVDVIVSASETDFDIAPVAAGIQRALAGFVVRRYPAEIDVLGGTTNVQARASRSRGAPFVHLELSHRLRERLSEDPALGRRLGQVLAEAAPPPRGG